MSLNLIPYIVIWSLLAASVVVLIVWRKMVSSNEDDTLHVGASAGVVMQQVNVANKLEVIDKWGKILTAIAVVSGLILGALWVYQSWVAASNISVG